MKRHGGLTHPIKRNTLCCRASRAIAYQPSPFLQHVAEEGNRLAALGRSLSHKDLGRIGGGSPARQRCCNCLIRRPLCLVCKTCHPILVSLYGSDCAAEVTPRYLRLHYTQVCRFLVRLVKCPSHCNPYLVIHLLESKQCKAVFNRAGSASLNGACGHRSRIDPNNISPTPCT